MHNHINIYSIRKFVFPSDVSWKTFSECIPQLCVKLSNLDSKKACLAYYKKTGKLKSNCVKQYDACFTGYIILYCIGHMVVKIGIQKSENLDPIIYNPSLVPRPLPAFQRSREKREGLVCDGT